MSGLDVILSNLVISLRKESGIGAGSAVKPHPLETLKQKVPGVGQPSHDMPEQARYLEI